MGAHSLVKPKEVAECSAHDANLIAGKKPRPSIKLNNSAGILAGFQCINNRLRNRSWPVAITNQSGDTDCRVNRQSTLRGQIDRHEYVARKQRRRYFLDTACVSPLLEKARQIDLELLAAQMVRRLGFSVGLGMRDVPTRAEIDAHGLRLSPSRSAGVRCDHRNANWTPQQNQPPTPQRSQPSTPIQQCRHAVAPE